MEDMIIKSLQDAEHQFNVSNMINIGIVVLLVIVLLIALTIVRKRLLQRFPIEDVRRKHLYITLFRAAKALVVAAGVIAILPMLGVNLSGFSAVFGVSLVVIIFAVKDSFQDIFTGLILMVDKYFAVGDAVEYDGKDGIVISFTVRTTKIQYLDDGSIISVANRNISQIRKLTHLVDIDLPLSYDLDRKTAYKVLTGICERAAEIEGVESCELKGTQQFAESAIIYKIRFFCDPKNRPDIRREVLRTIQDGLAEASIRIPYKQLDVHAK